MVFVSSIRYRDPAMLPLAVLAAGAIAYGQTQVDKRSTSATVASPAIRVAES